MQSVLSLNIIALHAAVRKAFGSICEEILALIVATYASCS